MIECKDIDYVLTIAKHQNISAAARELYISQPALTKYLQSLEARIGITLFDRSKRKLQPTLAGERYIAYAAEMAGIEDQMGREITRIKTEKNETLKMAFACTGLRAVIYEAISKIHQSEPSMQMDVRELRTPEIEQMILDYKLDIGFISLPTYSADLQAELYFEENIILCVPANNPLVALGKQIKESHYPWIDLALFRNEPFVLRSKGTRFGMLTAQMFEQCGITEPVNVLTSRSQFTSIEFAQANQVCFFLPESFVKIIRKPETFRYFLTCNVLPKISVGMVHRKGAALSIPARRFLHVMNAIISGDPDSRQAPAAE